MFFSCLSISYNILRIIKFNKLKRKNYLFLCMHRKNVELIKCCQVKTVGDLCSKTRSLHSYLYHKYAHVKSASPRNHTCENKQV